jgi:hypothetical protein
MAVPLKLISHCRRRLKFAANFKLVAPQTSANSKQIPKSTFLYLSNITRVTILTRYINRFSIGKPAFVCGR